MTAMRIERDSIGEMPIPAEADYGIHTARAVENFPITGIALSHYPELVQSLAMTKRAAAMANRELGTLKDRDHFSAWLYRIAHNTCFSKLRKDRGKYYVPIEPETKTTKTSPEKRIDVERALQTLPEDQREVVILKVFNDLKFEEIAAVQGAPVSTVKSRLYMSFENLRSILE